jgi:thymidylate synthase (FAD)
LGVVAQKVELLQYTPDPEGTIAMAAKLCYSQANIEDLRNIPAEKRAAFIQNLVDMGHLSPIEHASFTFGIEGVSRALLAQVTRHRIASFSVQSQRYVNKKYLENTFNYVIPPSIRELGSEFVEKYEQQMLMMQSWYNEWNDLLGGMGEKSNEDARFVLPNACETKMIITMNARELIHFFSLRCCNRAQWEIREMAWKMLELCMQAAPNLFGKAGPSCIGSPCPEGRMSCRKSSMVKQKHKEMAERIIK